MAKATIEAFPQEPAPAGSRPTTRRVRVSIRRISPWSVFKVSMVFYFCLLLVILVGLGILYGVLSTSGILDSISELLTGVGFGDAQGVFEFNAGYIFRTLFLVGLISTALWVGFTVFLAFLYNIIADLLGGIEVTLVERR
jgi:transmembrane protein DUF3566